MNPCDVITWGESLAVLNSTPERPLQWGDDVGVTFAGAESNVAIGLSRLGHSVKWRSVVGRDRFGSLVIQALRAEGIDVETVRATDAGPTALMVKLYSAWAEPSVTYYRDSSAFRRSPPLDGDFSWLDGARVLYLTGITPALSDDWARWCLRAITAARERQVLVWFDPNYRQRLWSEGRARRWCLPVLRSVDVVLCGLREGTILTGESDATAIALALRRHCTSEIIVKGGAEPAVVLRHNEITQARAPRKIAVVDAIGAGDGFAAGYLSAWLDGLGIAERLERAQALGALVCLARGDWEGLPSRGELAAFLQDQTESNR